MTPLTISLPNPYFVLFSALYISNPFNSYAKSRLFIHTPMFSLIQDHPFSSIPPPSFHFEPFFQLRVNNAMTLSQLLLQTAHQSRMMI